MFVFSWKVLLSSYNVVNTSRAVFIVMMMQKHSFFMFELAWLVYTQNKDSKGKPWRRRKLGIGTC